MPRPRHYSRCAACSPRLPHNPPIHPPDSESAPISQPTCCPRNVCIHQRSVFGSRIEVAPLTPLRYRLYLSKRHRRITAEGTVTARSSSHASSVAGYQFSMIQIFELFIISYKRIRIWSQLTKCKDSLKSTGTSYSPKRTSLKRDTSQSASHSTTTCFKTAPSSILDILETGMDILKCLKKM